ncbi:MAG: hypothetical protein FD127_3919 [Acidimicrobiaceae bacterium]|nr:MAG: hypothetical protein FD127_3919 [Acidimicrobiaceae bacterium]
MHAPDVVARRLHGLRVVATPTALDHATWRPAGIVMRIAADEVFAIGSTEVEIADKHAIIEPESAFVGWWLTNEQFASVVQPRLEWVLPRARPALAQVRPAGRGDRVLVVASSGLAHEAGARLFGAGSGAVRG